MSSLSEPTPSVPAILPGSTPPVATECDHHKKTCNVQLPSPSTTTGADNKWVPRALIINLFANAVAPWREGDPWGRGGGGGRR